MTINVGGVVLLSVLIVFAWWAWGMAGAIAVVAAYTVAKLEGRWA